MGATTHSQRTPRLQGIQALRFVAAMLVVLTHSTLYTSERLDSSLSVWRFGEVGVDIFFVISGIVMGVTAPHFLGKADGWKSFAMRRFVRIAPIYYIATTLKVVTLIAVPGAVLHSELTPGHTVLSYLFLPTTNAEGRHEPLLGVGWTLIFEMFFYAVFALALLIKVRPLHLCGVVMSALTIGSMFKQDDWPAVAMYLNPIVLYFVVGIVIAQWLSDRNVASLLRWTAWISFLWILVAAVNDHGVDWQFLFRHGWVVVLVALVALNESKIGPHVPNPFVFLGNASYSMYLFHPLMAPLVPVVLAKIGLISVPLSIVLSLVGVCIAASIIFRYVEQPILGFLTARLPYMGRRPVTVGMGDVPPR